MRFTDLLIEYITCIIKDFAYSLQRGFGVAMLISIITCAAGALLLHNYSGENFPASLKGMQSPLFHRYSSDHYELIDLMKSFYLFLICLLGPVMIVSQAESENSTKSAKIFSVNRVFILLIILAVACGLDYFLSRLEFNAHASENNPAIQTYLTGIWFLLRIFLPLILFAAGNYFTLMGKWGIHSVKQLVILFIFLWLFNEIAYEFLLMVDDYLIGLIMMIFNNSNSKFLINTILNVPAIAGMAIGYYCAIHSSVSVLNANKTSTNLNP